MRASCIKEVTGERYLKVRQVYAEICDENGCAVAVLSVLESWTNTRLKHAEQAEAMNARALREGRPPVQDHDLWIWRTKAELIEDLCGMFKRGALDTAIDLLLKKGLIKRRENPQNPRDRTHQYLLCIDHVNGLLEQKRNSANAEAEIDVPKSGKPPLLDGEEESGDNGEKPPTGVKSDPDFTEEQLERALKFCRWLSKQADEEPKDVYPPSQIEAAVDLLGSKPAEELREAVQWAHTRAYWATRVRTAGRLRQHWDDLRVEWQAVTKNGGGGNGGGRPDREQERRERNQRRMRGESV